MSLSRLAVVLTVANVCNGCGFIGLPVVRDFSDFEEFEFTVLKALGICRPLESVYAAKIQKDEDGDYVLNISVFDDISDDEVYCAQTIDPARDEPARAPCPVLRKLPARTMTDSKVEEMLDLFSRVHVEPWINAPCLLAVTYPCEIPRLMWDDYMVSFFYCEYPRIGVDGVAILEFLDSLRTD